MNNVPEFIHQNQIPALKTSMENNITNTRQIMYSQ